MLETCDEWRGQGRRALRSGRRSIAFVFECLLDSQVMGLVHGMF